MADVSLTEVAAELYAIPPAEFVSTRNKRVKQITDRELAQQVKELRKPSVAAWVVNLFATERADRLGQALLLADELREAQEDLDAPTLSKLGRDRRALTAQLAREAVSLATTRGERVTDSTLAAVQQTINAAFFDPDAAAAVASGRLVRELEPSSASPFDFDSAIAGDAPERKATPSLPADEVRARRKKKDAEKAVHAAERDLDRAKRDQEKADNERDDAASRADRLDQKVKELETELKKVGEDAKKALAEVDDMAGRVHEAAGRVIAAERAVEASRATLASD
ncbi:MAG: transposase [Microbacterium sp.]|uniref:transposase n=1 Tax=Microbacterium sp. TaxID=51671 RepID=UPI003F96106B